MLSILFVKTIYIKLIILVGDNKKTSSSSETFVAPSLYMVGHEVALRLRCVHSMSHQPDIYQSFNSHSINILFKKLTYSLLPFLTYV